MSTPDEALLSEVRQALTRSGWYLPIGAAPFAEGGGAWVFRCYAQRVASLVRGAIHVSGHSDDSDQIADQLLELLHSPDEGEKAVAAVKLSKAPEARMAREIQVMTAHNDPHLATVYTYDKEARPPRWFVMEYFRRHTLHRHLQRYRGRPIETLNAVLPIARSLGALHGGRISTSTDTRLVHRDIKTKNIFVADDGRLVLGDFGIGHKPEGTRYTEADNTSPKSMHWVPPWPEEDLNSPKQDVYMLVRVIYAMLTGEEALQPNWLEREKYRLTTLFPTVPNMQAVDDFIRAHIALHEADCASEDGDALTEQLQLLQAGLEGPRSQPELVFSWIGGEKNYVVPLSPGLARLPVHLQSPSPRLTARVKAGQAIRTLIKLEAEDGTQVAASNEVESRGDWGPAMTLTAKIEPGWYRITVHIEAVKGGGVCTGLVLYTE